MKTANWRTLADIEPAPFEAQWFKQMHSVPSQDGCNFRDFLPKIAAHSWPAAAANLQKTFGFDSVNHCFGEASFSWIKPLESQITRGFVHFLTIGSFYQRRERCSAFVRAAFACAQKDASIDKAWIPIDVCAIAEEGDIDILVQLTDGENRFGAIIEAKFGHKLTDGQLAKGERHVTAAGGRAWDTARSAFLVIAPTIKDIAPSQLAAAPNWRPASWWAFLSRLESEMQAGIDCGEYRRFRRTVWRKAY